jgi:large subunit ribosomal protein L15
MLNNFSDNSEVDYAQLLEKGVATKANKSRTIYKVVGVTVPDSDDETAAPVLTAKNLVVKAHAFTESARAAIEAAGGKCIVLSPTRHIPLEEAQADQAKLDAARLVKLKELRALKAKRAAEKELARV